MSLFNSNRERRLWLYALMVMVVIVLGLFIGQPLAEKFQNQNVSAFVFLLCMALIATAIVLRSVRKQTHNKELFVMFGIGAIYLMFFLRLTLAERSHLIEYSVLAIFIHEALLERFGREKNIIKTAVLAVVLTTVIGVIDECVQIFLPKRVFDFEDILFNSIVSVLAIVSSMLLIWARKKIWKSKK